MNTRSLLSTFLGAVVATGFVSGCGGESPDDDATGSTGEIHGAITGGILVPTESVGWATHATVQLNVSGGSSCSGLKVNASWYLTAAHCGFKGGQAVTVTNALVPAGGPSYNTTIAQAENHPTTFRGAQLRNDLALLRLRDSNPITTMSPGRFAQQVDNAGGTGVGYGCDLAPGSTNGGQKQWADFITAADPDSHANVYWFDSFTNPSLCSGDSGGPFYNILNGNKWYLTGLAQAWGGAGRSVSVWARVSPAREWISAVVSDLPGYNNFVDLNKGTFLNMASSWCAEFYQFGGPGSMLQFPCGLADDPKQRFWINFTNGGYEFRWLQDSNYCLAIQGASTANGAAVTVLQCDGSSNTRWVGQPNPNDAHYPLIKNLNSGKCMAAFDSTLFAGITQSTCTPGSSLGWAFTL